MSVIEQAILQKTIPQPKPEGALARQHSRRHKPAWKRRLLDAVRVLSGHYSLHLSWQVGFDEGQRMEWYRTVVMGGR